MGSPSSSPSSYAASCSSYAPPSSSDEPEEDESLSDDDKIEAKSERTATPKRVREKGDATHSSSNTSSSRHRRHRGRRRPDSEEEEEKEEEETDEDQEETEEEEEETEGDSRRERRQSRSQPQHHQPLHHQPQHHQPQHHHQRSHHHHHRHRHHHHQRHHHHHHQRQHHEHHQPRNVYRKHVVRRAHQKRVDAVDIPAPAEWLYHDAYAALRLRWEAQADLQLYADQKRRHEPRISINFGSRMVERGLVTAIQRVTNNPKIQKVDRKAPRLVVGGDLLPWGTWPTRLRNHDGQSFYAGGGRDGGGGGSGDILLLRDAVDGPFASCWAGSGGVGCSGGVEGVDSVTEDSIHDQLLLRRSLASPSPSPSCPPSHAPFGCSSSLRDRLPLRKPPLSRQGGGGGDDGGGRDDNSDGMADDGYRERRDHHHEGTVRRLVPDGRGRWVEARAEPSRRASGAATSGGDTQGATAGPRSRSRSSPPHETPFAAATTAPAIATTPAPVVAKRLVPGWYGGWAEVEDTPGQTARAAAAAAAAAVAAARPGPDDGAACSVLETWKTSGRKRQRGDRVLGTAGDGGQGSGTDGAAGGGGGEEDEDGGRAGRRRCNDSDVHARGGGEGLSDSDGGCGGGGGWRGWTVSEPAKEAVRRVWGRATRRARDAFEPRHRCGAVTTDGCPTPEKKRVRGGEAAAAVHAAANFHAATAAESADCDCEVEGADSGDAFGGADSDNEVGDDAAARYPNGRNYVDDRSSTFTDPCGDGAGDNRDEPSPRRASPPRVAGGIVRDRLDPGLLSCLGRECEGIIDAALHVVLGEQLLRSSSRSSSECVGGNPPEAADWQDVLSTMSRCSKRARRASPRDSDPSLHTRGGGGGSGRERGAGGGGREGGGRREREGDGAASRMGVASSRPRRRAGGVCTEECPQAVASSARGGTGTERREIAKETAVWGAGEPSDGAVVVVNERLPGLPLNEAVLTRSYNRLLIYLHEKKSWEA